MLGSTQISPAMPFFHKQTDFGVFGCSLFLGHNTRLVGGEIICLSIAGTEVRPYPNQLAELVFDVPCLIWIFFWIFGTRQILLRLPGTVLSLVTHIFRLVFSCCSWAWSAVRDWIGHGLIARPVNQSTQSTMGANAAPAGGSGDSCRKWGNNRISGKVRRTWLAEPGWRRQ